jgi:hypothetical protein
VEATQAPKGKVNRGLQSEILTESLFFWIACVGEVDTFCKGKSVSYISQSLHDHRFPRGSGMGLFWPVGPG